MALRFEPVLEDEQIQRAAALAREIWSEHYTPIIGRAQVEYMLAAFQSPPAIKRQIAEGYEYYLALDDNVPFGYMAIKLKGDELFLSKLYVAAARRGRGRGKACFEFVLERARALGAASVLLTVNKGNDAAIAAYERWGFVRARAVVTDIGQGFVMDDWEYRYCCAA